MTGHRSARRWAGALLGTALIAGCSERVDKAGRPAEPAPIVLRAITPLGGELAGHVFADQVAELSDHRLSVAVQESWSGTDPDTAEADAIGAVESGAADIGIVPVRAWHEEGVTSFDALTAPMEIETAELNQAVLQSPIADEMLADMHGRPGVRVRPIGLLPGPIVRLDGISRSLTELDELRGAQVATPRSAVADRSLDALGARPVHSYFGGADVSGFDGLAAQIEVVHGNSYDGIVRDVVTNVGLWPRSMVVFGNGSALDALPPGTSDLLAEAARRAVGPSAKAQSQAEATSVEILCAGGLTALASATPGQVAAFRQAFAPVYDWLREDQPTREFLRRIDQLKADADLPPPNPVQCPHPAAALTSSPAATESSVGITAPATPLDGVWEMHATAGEMAAYTGDDPSTIQECNYGTFRWTFSHGLYAESQHAGTTDTWASGTITVAGDEFTLHIGEGGGTGPDGICHARAGDVYTWHWSVYHDRLTVRWFDPSAVDYPENYEVKPWLRIGDAAATVSSTR